MDQDNYKYSSLEDDYSKICETHNLLFHVLTLRREIPKLYQGLLKQEAKIWAFKLQHPKVKLATESLNVLEVIHSNAYNYIEGVDEKMSVLNTKSLENKKLLNKVAKKREDLMKMKKWLDLRKAINKTL